MRLLQSLAETSSARIHLHSDDLESCRFQPNETSLRCCRSHCRDCDRPAALLGKSDPGHVGAGTHPDLQKSPVLVGDRTDFQVAREQASVAHEVSAKELPSGLVVVVEDSAVFEPLMVAGVDLDQLAEASVGPKSALCSRIKSGIGPASGPADQRCTRLRAVRLLALLPAAKEALKDRSFS